MVVRENRSRLTTAVILRLVLPGSKALYSDTLISLGLSVYLNTVYSISYLMLNHHVQRTFLVIRLMTKR